MRKQKFLIVAFLKDIFGQFKILQELFAKLLTYVNDQEMIGNLLVAYNASENENDKAIFDLLFHLERTCRMSFRLVEYQNLFNLYPQYQF